MSPSGSMDMLTLMAGGASSSERISPALDSEESTSPLSELKAEQLTRNSPEPPHQVETLRDRIAARKQREEAAAAADTGDKPSIRSSNDSAGGLKVVNKSNNNNQDIVVEDSNVLRQRILARKNKNARQRATL